MLLTFTKSKLRAGLIFIALSLVYRFALDIFFIQFSSDFAYYGVIYLPRSSLEIIISYLAVIIAASTIDYSTNRPSNSIHLMLFLFCFVPTSVHFALNSNLGWEPFYGLFGFFLFAPISRELLSGAKNVKIRTLRLKQYSQLISSALLLGLGLIVWQYGFSFNIDSITEVYDQRAAFKSASGKGMKYMVQWIANVINVVFVLWSLVNRKYLFAGFSILLSLYLFSLGGHKSFLFVTPLAAVLYGLVKFFRKDFNIALVISLVVAVVFILVYDLASERDYSLISSLFIRRSILLPSQIYFYYCDYFSTRDVNLFSQNIPFKFFLSSPYDMRIPDIIGQHYFHHREELYANGNVFADTFSNVGLLSYPLLAIVLPSLYSLIDWAAQKKHLAFTIPLIFMASHVLLNSGLIVTLITHGLFLAIILLAIYPRNIWRIKKIVGKT
jgi:hypothetical protein